MNSEDGHFYTTVCSQNINKQNVNIADETLTNYSFLSMCHYTKSKNYLKRRYWILHWIPMFFGTPCIYTTLICLNQLMRFSGSSLYPLSIFLYCPFNKIGINHWSRYPQYSQLRYKMIDLSCSSSSCISCFVSSACFKPSLIFIILDKFHFLKMKFNVKS